jgi:RNA polymerase sigma-70 factor, ECF subfamily
LDEFTHLYKKYRNQIYRYLFGLSGDKSAAEELTQETFLQAFQSIHRFKGNSKVSTWLFQIAKYTYYSYIKKNNKIERTADALKFEDQLPDKDTPEVIYEKKESSNHVLAAIKQLKQPQQDIVILRLYNEMSFSEIGDIFSQTDQWARVNFYRAKNKLAVMMEGGKKA